MRENRTTWKDRLISIWSKLLNISLGWEENKRGRRSSDLLRRIIIFLRFPILPLFLWGFIRTPSMQSCKRFLYQCCGQNGWGPLVQVGHLVCLLVQIGPTICVCVGMKRSMLQCGVPIGGLWLAPDTIGPSLRQGYQVVWYEVLGREAQALICTECCIIESRLSENTFT